MAAGPVDIPYRACKAVGLGFVGSAVDGADGIAAGLKAAGAHGWCCCLQAYGWELVGLL